MTSLACVVEAIAATVSPVTVPPWPSPWPRDAQVPIGDPDEDDGGWDDDDEEEDEDDEEEDDDGMQLRRADAVAGRRPR